MTWVRRLLVGLLAILVVVALVANFYLGSLVKVAVETAGPAIMGVPVHLKEAHFRLLRGHVTLQGFVLGNPVGFRTEHAISVDEIVVDLSVRSLLGKTLVIKRIYVKAPVITYELGLGQSNIGRILEQLEGAEPAAKPGQHEAAARGGKKVIIDDFLIEGGRVQLSAKVAMGAAAPIPLPRIHLTGIGREAGSEGASPVQVIKRVFGAIVHAVTGVVTGSAKLVGDGVEAVGKGAVKAADALGDGAGKLLGGLKDLVPGQQGR
ncbi:MAG: hypothetical protein K8T26_00645 [Lentisphaerae bacterium]|nr:hypothetical protein [Lentisphaerota bacterium]